MTTDEAWDKLLLPLADLYESPLPGRWVDPGPMFAETIEVVRECLDLKEAEGSLTRIRAVNLCRLTKQGYARYKARVDFLRSPGVPDWNRPSSV